MPPERYDMVMAHSLLHLLADKEAALKAMFDTLTPGGYLVTSTSCVADFLSVFKYIAPIGYALRLLPLVKVFSQSDLLASIRNAGFEVEYTWQPDAKASVFVMARKPAAV